MRPLPTETHPSAMGSEAMGNTQEARYACIRSTESHGFPLTALRRVVSELLRYGIVAVFTGRCQGQHPRHVALAEDRIAEQFVVHVAPLGDEAGILDIRDDLNLVHAVARPGRPHDVLFDHHTAH